MAERLALAVARMPTAAALAAAYVRLGATTALEREHAVLRDLAILGSELAGVPLIRVTPGSIGGTRRA